MTDPCSSGPALNRALGRTGAIALVLGSVIGSGIFFKPQKVAELLGSVEWVMLVWVVAGLLCILGALSLAELAAMIPRAGGLYVYLREGYGKLIAFLYGWCLFLLVRPAAVGALATAFAISLPIDDGWKLVVSMSTIGVLAWVNVMGVVWGGRMQNLTTLIKVSFLSAIILLPWVVGAADPVNFSTTLGVSETGVTLSNFMAALLAVMFAYNSWHEVTPLAEEIKEPQRNLPWALLMGVGFLTILYVGANIAYHSVLTMSEVVSEKNSAKAVMDHIFGPVGGTIMTVLVMCSVFGTLNANLLHAPRVYFAMGRDGVFFPSLGRLHAVRRTPMAAILTQGGLACVMILIAAATEGDVFGLLTNLAVFGNSIFYLLAVFAVIILRRRQPARDRPYRTLGYPWPPLVFVLCYACFLPSIFVARPLESGFGLGVIALGIPVFFIWNSRNG
ncbi:MAG: amino acid permease, partial [Planctomycetota bacterium]|nr:amino acid permease [Planctomycetota bacterium]